MYSPLEQFTVLPLLSVLGLSLTNLLLYGLISLILIVLFHSTLKNITGNGWTVPIETSVASVSQTVKEQSGTDSYLPLLYSVFSVILVANLLGNIPYGFALTSSAAVCMGLSIMVFLGVTILGVSLHRLHFLSFFVPTGTPLALVPMLVLIELISYLSRSVSLGVRLFSNIVAGHTLLKILSTFLLGLFQSSILVAVVTLVPFALFLSLIGLELAVSFIQSYVFVILMSSYIRDARELH